jgi:O-antigen ligase
LLLPPLAIDWGSTGPHPALLFAACGVWIGLLRPREWTVPVNLLTASLGAFSLLLLASVPWAAASRGWEVAAGSLARAMLFGLGPYVLFYSAWGPARSDARTSIEWVRPVYWLGAAAAVLACVDFYYQWQPMAGYAEQFVWLPDRIVRRAQGFFYDAGMLGNFSFFFLTMIALAWVRPEVRRFLPSGRALIAGAVVFSAALVFSFSRSSVLGLSVAVGTMLFLHRGRARYGRLLLLMLLAVLLASGGLLLAFAIVPDFAASYLDRLWRTATGLGSSPDTLLAGRWQTWEAILGFVFEQPWVLLTGTGFKTLPYTEFAGEKLIADNMYLTILVEAGIFGFLALLFSLGAILRASYQVAWSQDPERAFLGAWIFCFWVGMLFQMLSVDALTYWRVLPVYFLFLGLALREGRLPAPNRFQARLGPP